MFTEYVCTSCGTVSRGKRTIKGSALLEIVLWCCMILPGLLYTIYRLHTREIVCPKCRKSTIIPANTPFAQKYMVHHS